MAITVTSLVGNGDKTASASLAVTLGATGVAAGETILVGIAADNAGTSGVNSISSVTDSQSNTYTQVFLKNQTPGAAANDGTTVALYAALATTALVASTDSVTVNFSPNTTAKAFWVSKMAGGNYNSSSNNTASGAGTAYTSGGASASITSGDVIFGVAANESGTAPANDTDTTNGSWTQATQSSGGTGSDNTKQAVGMSWKVVTATGAQTFNGATGANTDWAAGYAIFPAKVTTTITPAAGSVTATGQTPTLKTTLKPAAASLTTSLKTPGVYQMPLKPAAASLTTSLKTPTLKTTLNLIPYASPGNAYENADHTDATSVTSLTLNWSYGIPKINNLYLAAVVAINESSAITASTVTDNAGNTWSVYWTTTVGGNRRYGLLYTFATKTLAAGSTWSITFTPASGTTQNLSVQVLEIAGAARGWDAAAGSGSGSAPSLTYPYKQLSSRDVKYSLFVFFASSSNLITSTPTGTASQFDSAGTYTYGYTVGAANRTDSNSWTSTWGLSSSVDYNIWLQEIQMGVPVTPQTPTLKTVLNPAAASLTTSLKTPTLITTTVIKPAAGSLTTSLKTPALKTALKPAVASLTATPQTPTLKQTLNPIFSSSGGGLVNFGYIENASASSVTFSAYAAPLIGRVFFLAVSTSNSTSPASVSDSAGNSWHLVFSQSGLGGCFALYSTVCTAVIPKDGVTTWDITATAASGGNQKMIAELSVFYGAGAGATGYGYNSFQTQNGTTSSVSYQVPYGQPAEGLAYFSWLPSATNTVILQYPNRNAFLSDSAASYGAAITAGGADLSSAQTSPFILGWRWRSTYANGWAIAVLVMQNASKLSASYPDLTNTLSPAAASLTATGQTPVVTVTSGGDVTVTPAAGSLAATGQTPTTTLVIPPTAGALAVTGQTPTLTLVLSPAAASLTTTLQTPTLTDVLRPAAGTLALTGQTPVLVTTLSPAAGTLTVTGRTPTTTLVIPPAAGSLTATGQTPVVSIAIIISPAAGAMTATGQTPTLALVIHPAAGALVVTGRTPSLEVTTSPAAGALTATGQTPTLASAIKPAVGTLTTTRFTPTLTLVIRPAAGAVTLTGQTPVVINRQTITPTNGSLVLTGLAPALAATIRPTKGTLALGGRTPALKSIVRPTAGSLVLTGQQVGFAGAIAWTETSTSVRMAYGSTSASIAESSTSVGLRNRSTRAMITEVVI